MESRQGVVLHIPDFNDQQSDTIQFHVESCSQETPTAKPRKKAKVTASPALPVSKSRVGRRKASKPTKIFKCDFCSHVSVRKVDLYYHSLTHTDEKPYRCPLCEKRFQRPDYVTNHLRTHTGEKPYSCPVCHQAFALKANLNKHVLIHSEPKYKCSRCGKEFRRPSHLRLHVSTHDRQRKPCPICKCLLKSDIRKHIRRVHKDELKSERTKKLKENDEKVVDKVLYSCSHCKTDFESHLDLMQHIEQYLESVRNETREDKTADQMASVEGVSSSGALMVIDADSLPQEVEVIVPPQSLEDAVLAIQHHLPDQNFSENIGNQVVNSVDIDNPENRDITENTDSVNADSDRNPAALICIGTSSKENPISVPKNQENKLSDSAIPSKNNSTREVESHVCKVCGVKLAGKYSLAVHSRTHTGEKPYLCQDCGKRFKDKSNYNKHRQTHSGDKAYKCSLCPAAFGRNCHLKKHMKSHENSRDFACDLCEARFNHRPTLAAHVKTVHRQRERSQRTVPLRSCGYGTCHLSFRSLTALKQHRIQVHGGAYLCQICSEKFKSESSLQKHMSQHEVNGCSSSMIGLDDILKDI